MNDPESVTAGEVLGMARFAMAFGLVAQKAALEI
jgi:hypothetical protein